MTDLVVCMVDKTGFSHIKDLVEKNEWDKIFVVTSEEMMDVEFKGEVNFLLIDKNKSTEDLINHIVDSLKPNISGMEVAINLFSGSGKVHMAIMASLLKLGLGIRLVKQGEVSVVEL